MTGPTLFVTLFPNPSEPRRQTAYGPFSDFATAKNHARTLSLDPEEGVVLRLLPPEESKS